AVERSVREVLPRDGAAVPVPPRPVPGRGPQRTAAHVLDLRQQGSGAEVLGDAVDGREQAVAGRTGGANRFTGNGCRGDSGVLRAAGGVDEEGESRGAVRMVGNFSAGSSITGYGKSNRRPATGNRQQATGNEDRREHRGKAARCRSGDATYRWGAAGEP